MTLIQQSIDQLQKIRSKRHPDNFNIVFMGDSWVGSGEVSNNIFQVAMESAMSFNPLLCCHGGDAVFRGTAKELEDFVATVERLNTDKKGNKVPFFLVPGNHDAVLNRETNILNPENYKNIIGPPSLHWFIDLPEYDFKMIGLNSLFHNVYKVYGLTETELDFLATHLSPQRRNTFVIMHVPPRELQLEWEAGDAFPNGRGRQEFYRIVRGRVSEVLVSHIHDFQLARAHGVNFVLSGGSGATLNVNAKFHIVVINIQRRGARTFVTPVFVPVGWTREKEPISP